MAKVLMTSNSKRDLWNILSIALIAAGALAQTVTQTPDEVVYQLAQNASMDCQFIHTPDQQVAKNPILYWHKITSLTKMTRLWPDPESPYKDRVEVLDSDRNSPNRSVLLKNVQWEDSSGKYECKLSYRAAKQDKRMKGSGVKLFIHDLMFFGLDPDNETQLMCAVNVSRDDGFFLSLLQDGSKVFQKTIDLLHPSMSLSVTLSVILPLEKGKNYECQIHLGSTLIMSQPFQQPLETPAVEKVLPEPVFLFVAILLVPITVLLALLTALLVLRR
ncbi:uncharacterized protein [Salvelinus alpinus]|uniref:uncharacterized protein isoform X1 n=2 Tax=Salvelinus alpinus TaxID=8036 RepID=UPI0039FC7476